VTAVFIAELYRFCGWLRKKLHNIGCPIGSKNGNSGSELRSAEASGVNLIIRNQDVKWKEKFGVECVVCIYAM
jgi:hypothetical protein